MLSAADSDGLSLACGVWVHKVQEQGAPTDHKLQNHFYLNIPWQGLPAFPALLVTQTRWEALYVHEHTSVDQENPTYQNSDLEDKKHLVIYLC